MKNLYVNAVEWNERGVSVLEKLPYDITYVIHFLLDTTERDTSTRSERVSEWEKAFAVYVGESRCSMSIQEKKQQEEREKENTEHAYMTAVLSLSLGE